MIIVNDFNFVSKLIFFLNTYKICTQVHSEMKNNLFYTSSLSYNCLSNQSRGQNIMFILFKNVLFTQNFFFQE